MDRELRLMMDLTLRPWHLDDLAALVLHANDAGIAQYMTDTFPHPYTEESGRAFIQRFADDDPTLVFCIEVEGEAVGSIGLYPQGDIMRRNAELGYWLGRSHWGRGIITEAIKRTVAHAFATLPINRIYARPFGSNLASQRVLEKTGFLLEAELLGTIEKNGRVEDELIYAVRR